MPRCFSLFMSYMAYGDVSAGCCCDCTGLDAAVAAAAAAEVVMIAVAPMVVVWAVVNPVQVVVIMAFVAPELVGMAMLVGTSAGDPR
jgi:hypothetical protein